jgi:hypothetical protein
MGLKRNKYIIKEIKIEPILDKILEYETIWIQ